jgi:predicted Zn-dependent peptidase
MTINTYTLTNGIRLLHVAERIPIVYCGVAINAGTRDELPDESGIAHFVEHMLFKGTTHRKSWHIINRLESVGGQLDAYTTKEETFVYATVPTRYTNRALELLADVVFNSQFPQRELEKEKEIVIDEIRSYNDSPSELIYDDFEEMLFSTDPIGRNILGTEESLATFNTAKMKRFTERCHTTDEMVIFFMGDISFDKVVRTSERYFSVPASKRMFQRTVPSTYVPMSKSMEKDTYQAHCLIGARCCPADSEERLPLVLLNNILGGPNMTSRLNMAVRERNGLAYTIESSLTNYTDTGIWSIYFGCDSKNLKRALSLCDKEMERLMNERLPESQLATAKCQVEGQVLIGDQSKENLILVMAKNYLQRQPLRSNEELLDIIRAVSSEKLRSLAEESFDKKNRSMLIYQ